VVSACGYIAVERKASISSRHFAVDLKRIADFDEDMLRGKSGLTSQERSALQAHMRATRRKYDYHRVLDCKRDRGLTAALALLATMPASWGHIAAQTIRARLQKWPIKPFTAAAVHNRDQPRFLLGQTLSPADRPYPNGADVKSATPDRTTA
jgi:hypothetical protein